MAISPATVASFAGVSITPAGAVGVFKVTATDWAIANEFDAVLWP